jgi:hypothetical protein
MGSYLATVGAFTPRKDSVISSTNQSRTISPGFFNLFLSLCLSILGDCASRLGGLMEEARMYVEAIGTVELGIPIYLKLIEFQ